MFNVSFGKGKAFFSKEKKGFVCIKSEEDYECKVKVFLGYTVWNPPDVRGFYTPLLLNKAIASLISSVHDSIIDNNS